MKKDKCDVRTVSNTIEVTGYAWKLEGYNHDFVVHLHIFNIEGYENRWSVTHKETGFEMPLEPAFTRKDAIKNCEALLRKFTPAQFDLTVEQNIQMYCATNPS